MNNGEICHLYCNNSNKKSSESFDICKTIHRTYYSENICASHNFSLYNGFQI